MELNALFLKFFYAMWYKSGIRIKIFVILKRFNKFALSTEKVNFEI